MTAGTQPVAYIAALFTKAERWKQPKDSMMDEKINKIWYEYIHAIECYSTLTNDATVMHATMQTKSRNFMSSKIGQTHRTHIAWFHLHEVPKIGIFTDKL